MATSVLYYQSPMVHTPSTYQCAGPLYPHPALQSQPPQPSVPLLPPQNIQRSPPAAPQRKSVSKSGPMPMNQQEASPLFRLPAELRNQIYAELLCPDSMSPAQLARQAKDLQTRGFNQTTTPVSLHPAILSTCRRIAEEAEGMLYSTAVFHAHPSLLTSLPHLTSQARPVLYPAVTSQIRRWQISLRLDTDPRFTYAQVQKAFSGAEYLEIRVWQAQFEACDYAVLKLFCGVRGVKVARVGGSVDPELAHWLEKLMMQPEERNVAKCRCRPEDDESLFVSRLEVLCGRCYRKVGCVGWSAAERDVWRVGR